MSEKKVQLLSFSKDINFTHHHDNGKTVRLMMNIYYEKPIDYDAVVQLFVERYQRMLLVDPFFDKTQN